MTREDIKILKEIQRGSVEFTDILGTHKGVINTLKVRDNGIYAYCLFFGMNIWLRLNESTMQWEEAHVR